MFLRKCNESSCTIASAKVERWPNREGALVFKKKTDKEAKKKINLRV
jgi:hypothetical protein